MRSAQEIIPVLQRTSMRDDILAGLRAREKFISPKYFYDAIGSCLFEAICQTPEYYVTRVEKGLLSEVADHVARLVGPGAVLIEPGSGSSEKVQMIMERLRPSAYVPVEICAAALSSAVERLGEAYPWLRILPHCADFDLDALD